MNEEKNFTKDAIEWVSVPLKGSFVLNIGAGIAYAEDSKIVSVPLKGSFVLNILDETDWLYVERLFPSP